MNPVVWPWMLEISLVTYRSLSGLHFVPTDIVLLNSQSETSGGWINNGRRRPPLPSELLATVVAFGGAGIIAEHNPRIGSLLAWGLVLATAITMFANVKPTQTLGQTLTTPPSTQKPILA